MPKVSDQMCVPSEEDPQEPMAPMATVEAPTLDDAFVVLARALLPLLEENMPMYTYVEECLGVYANGNHTIAWTRVIAILEGVLETPLRPS